jgi:hypothetical protein
MHISFRGAKGDFTLTFRSEPPPKKSRKKGSYLRPVPKLGWVEDAVSDFAAVLGEGR